VYVLNGAMPLDRVQTSQLKALGANIRRERVSQGISQERLGEMARLHPRTIQKIEAGRVDILYTTLIRIQRALRSSWEQLLGKP
jgi:transcriptional regulator with XRE-family HTH domain